MLQADMPRLLPWKAHRDERGAFKEEYVEGQHPQIVGPVHQLSTVRSRWGVVRGLHYNALGKQWKQMFAVIGTHWAVAVDVRKDSPTAGAWVSTYLDEGKAAFWVPPGFASGLLCLSDGGVAMYLSNVGGDPVNARSLGVFSDVNVRWPILPEVLVANERDRACMTLKEFWSSYD